MLSEINPTEYYDLTINLPNEEKILCNPEDYDKFKRICEIAYNMIFLIAKASKESISDVIETVPIPTVRMCYYGDNSTIHRLVTCYTTYRCIERY